MRPAEKRGQLTIAVAMCTYNGAPYLPIQLESIASQSRKPDLLLVSDDGSNDKTVELVQAFAARARFSVSITRNPVNLGHLRNFESAIARCDADVIVLSDQDDWWSPEKLKLLEDKFRADGEAGAVFSDAQIVGADLEDLGYTLFDALMVSDAERLELGSGKVFPALLRRNVVCGATLAMRSTWKERVLPFPEGVMHDEWISLVVGAYSALRFVPGALIKYRQHGENQIGLPTGTWRLRMRRFMSHRLDAHARRLRLLQSLYQRLQQNSAPKPALEEIEQKIAHMQQRLASSHSLLRRIGLVAGELISGRYSRYSFGWISAAQDLVRPMK